MKEIADERFAVGRESESLANFAMGQDRIFEIKTEVGEIRAGAIGHCKIGLARENGNDVRRKRTHLKIGRAFAKFERANDTVGDDAESHARDPRARHESTQDFVRRPPLRPATAARSERGRSRWGGGKNRRRRSLERSQWRSE